MASTIRPALCRRSMSSEYISTSATTRASSLAPCLSSTFSFQFHRPRHQQVRHAATAKRTRKALNLPPAPTFGGPASPTGSSGRSRISKQKQQTSGAALGDTIIFDPPPSVPNVYHTPSKFLPKTDARRKLLDKRAEEARQSVFGEQGSSSSSSGTPLASDSASGVPTAAELPPPLKTPYEKTYHLGPEAIAEMRRLRREDEKYWTSYKLAEKFNCSRLFVGMCVQASKERLEELERRKKEIMGRWGKKKRLAWEERAMRKETWGQG